MFNDPFMPERWSTGGHLTRLLTHRYYSHCFLQHTSQELADSLKVAMLRNHLIADVDDCNL